LSAISQTIAQKFSAQKKVKSCFLETKLLKSSVLKKSQKLLFVDKGTQILLQKQTKKNHFVALFLYLVWCKNMQTVRQKVRFLSIFEQFCGVTSVAK